MTDKYETTSDHRLMETPMLDSNYCVPAKWGTGLEVGILKPFESSIIFSNPETSKMVMKITRDKIEVDPDIEADEAAHIVLNAIETMYVGRYCEIWNEAIQAAHDHLMKSNDRYRNDYFAAKVLELKK